MTVRTMELSVGAFLALGGLAFIILVFQVANIDFNGGGEQYKLHAYFDNIGGLKVNSPVRVGGVVIGRVSEIELDSQQMLPKVSMAISRQYMQFPSTSSLAILTSGLLGEQYIGLTPGFLMDEEDTLGDDDWVDDTRSAIVLEELIGQFIYQIGDNE